MSNPDGVLLPHGGYEHLRSYKVAEAVYDATVVFCNRFIDKEPTYDHRGLTWPASGWGKARDTS